ncbi:hypothetical protein Gogos_022376 [Gossypium gossypioides]|uniref:Uncharacterized protein n=1 Tax=Gossypium gossypioides TaxID=34282 RepID=A0A7J9D499_GOSGO|nr:hypothetical protein [Gossypium gossypioides]
MFSLSYNQFSRNISALQSLTLLESLDLSSNQFYGNISALETLTSLQLLDISNNKFHILCSLKPLFNLSKLKYLYADNNTIHTDDHEMPHSSAPRFQLTSISLSCYGRVGSFPRFLYHRSELQDVTLSGIYFKVDRFPFWLVENNTESRLEALDVNRNQLFGRLPQWRGNASNLAQVSMADKRLKGSIPRAICNLNLKLKLLDLSNNSLSGTLPSCFKPVSVREVHLSRNMLQGPLPNAFRDSSSLVTLDISYNHLKGNILNWIINLYELSYLLLKRNHFEDEIPIQLCKLDRLSLIDLSQNNLSDGIPSCLKVYAVNYVTEQYIRHQTIYTKKTIFRSIEVPIEYTVKSKSYNYKRRMLQYMYGIDLSCNKLTGEISFETKNSMKLFTLNLSHNSFIGPVPRAFSNLKDMESLDLSYNNLIGNIPAKFAVLHFLEYFNVSYNNLSGKTPERIGQLGAFDENSYVGNPFFCGSLVGKNCSCRSNYACSPYTLLIF